MDESNPERYIFFEKTADAKFQAFGATLEEAFKHALEAMMCLTYNITEITDNTIDIETRDFIVAGENLEALLYNFLEESLFLLSAEFFVGLAKTILIKKTETGFKLKAILEGTQSLNLESIGPEIKAVTYNEMYVKLDEKTGQYVAQVVVDI